MVRSKQEMANMVSQTLSPESRLVRVSAVAKHLSVSRSKVYLMMDAGELAYVKLGKSRRVPMSAVEKLIADSLVTA